MVYKIITYSLYTQVISAPYLVNPVNFGGSVPLKFIISLNWNSYKFQGLSFLSAARGDIWHTVCLVLPYEMTSGFSNLVNIFQN